MLTRFKNKKMFVGAVILIAVFLIVLNMFAASHIKNAFHFIFSPIEKVLWQNGGGVADFFAGVFNAKELKINNENLVSLSFTLKSQLRNLRNLESENKRLRVALDIGLNQEFDLELADIISKTTDPDIILINKGKKSGIKNGMAIISESKVLVGIVSEVFSGFSSVALISHSETSFSISIKSFFATSSPTGAVVGLAVGSGNFGLGYQMVPEENEIKANDLVFTANIDDVFPADLLVGEIKTVRASDASGFKQGTIEPYFAENIPDQVFVIKNFKQE